MIVQQRALTLNALRHLVSGRALILHVPSYHSPDLCEVLADRLLHDLEDSGSYQRLYESNVPAFTETVHDQRRMDTYLSGTSSALARLREICHPLASPIDRLRCELDEIWPGGASLLRITGRPLVFGILRVWRNGAEALPHLDILGEGAPDVPDARSFTEQLGVNIYLRTPHASNGDGAIEMWDVGLAEADPTGHGINGTYGFRRELLAEPSVVVHPRPGDLVILRSTRMHAVRATTEGSRITLSGFVGLGGVDETLRLWS